MKNHTILKMVRTHKMDKDTFSKLKVADIKALFETEQALEILPLAREDGFVVLYKNWPLLTLSRQRKRAKRTATDLH